MTQVQTIRLTRDGDIATLTLSRPERMNAFTRQMHDELAEVLAELEAAPPHVLILTGEGRGFCAGQDLGERYTQIQAGEVIHLQASLEETYNRNLTRLAKLPSLILTAVNGVAAGAGVGFAMLGDLILASRKAQFMLAFNKVGLGPDAGVSFNLPERIGLQRAMGLVLTGEPLGAEKALEWGLVWEVCEPEDLVPRATALAQALAKGSLAAQLSSKRLMREASPTLVEALTREAQSQEALGLSDYYRNAVVAFSTKAK